MFNTWEELDEAIKDCKKCKLCNNRTNIVLGTGNKNAKVMFIGEGPGADEDSMRYSFCRKSRKINGPSITRLRN